MDRRMPRGEFLLYIRALFVFVVLYSFNSFRDLIGLYLGEFFAPEGVKIADARKKKRRKKKPQGDTPPPNGRKHISRWSDAEFKGFVDALMIVNEDGRYLDFVKRHHRAMAVAHRGPKFLYWHRKFILEFEELLRSAGTGFSRLPIVFWHRQADVDRIMRVLDIRLFSNWRTLRWDENAQDVVENPQRGLIRHVGQGVSRPPSATDVERLGNYHEYDELPANTFVNSMRNWLEGWLNGPAMHNRIHVWIGGDAELSTSPNDPLFWIIHVWVDFLWWVWQLANPGKTISVVSNQNENMDFLLSPTTPAEMEEIPVAYQTGLMSYPQQSVAKAASTESGTRQRNHDKAAMDGGHTQSMGRHPKEDFEIKHGIIRASSILIESDGSIVFHNILMFRRFKRLEDAQPLLDQLAAEGRFVPAKGKTEVSKNPAEETGTTEGFFDPKTEVGDGDTNHQHPDSIEEQRPEKPKPSADSGNPDTKKGDGKNGKHQHSGTSKDLPAEDSESSGDPADPKPKKDGKKGNHQKHDNGKAHNKHGQGGHDRNTHKKHAVKTGDLVRL
jgi:tyrosinase